MYACNFISCIFKSFFRVRKTNFCSTMKRLLVRLLFLVLFSATVERCESTPIRVDTSVKGDDFLQEVGVAPETFPPKHIGSAIAPVVGAVVGPLLVNIAHGITNGITSTLESEFDHFGHSDKYPLQIGHHYDLFMVNVDGESRPYLLLNPIDNIDSAPLHYYGAASQFNNDHYHYKGTRSNMADNLLHRQALVKNKQKRVLPQIVDVSR